MKRITLIVLIAALAVPGTKTFGQRKIDYSQLTIALNFTGTSSLTVVVLDNREVVLDKSQEDNFTGYLRSAAGIAWPLKTRSGKPFSNDMGNSIASSFNEKGFKAAFLPVSPFDKMEDILHKCRETPSARTLVITLHKWSTDGYVKQWLDYDIDLSVYDANLGKLISRKFSVTAKPLGGSVMWGAGKYKAYMPEATAKELSAILNDTELVAAIQ